MSKPVLAFLLLWVPICRLVAQSNEVIRKPPAWGASAMFLGYAPLVGGLAHYQAYRAKALAIDGAVGMGFLLPLPFGRQASQFVLTIPHHLTASVGKQGRQFEFGYVGAWYSNQVWGRSQYDLGGNFVSGKSAAYMPGLLVGYRRDVVETGLLLRGYLSALLFQEQFDTYNTAGYPVHRTSLRSVWMPGFSIGKTF